MGKRIYDDTISAIATPLQKGAVGIIRISGKEAEKILLKLMPSVKKPVEERRVYYGKIIDPLSCKMTDEGLCFLMRAPYSYTGEDVVEIQAHGGVYNLLKILDITFKCGAREAQPGEFTRRALINGKIDLLQAESILDIVEAKSEAQLQIAAKQLKGEFSREIKRLKENIIEILGRIEASIDFVDEDESFYSKEEISKMFEISLSEIMNILGSFQKGSRIRQGVKIVICGKPNSGKSTLFNKILKEERAIVHEKPGTTRDFIAENLVIDGMLVHLIDTAGVRRADDPVEMEGVRRTLKCIEDGDILLVLFDGSSFFDDNDKYLIELSHSKNSIYIKNKIDLLQKFKYSGEIKFLNTSLKTGEGFANLMKFISFKLKDFLQMPSSSKSILTRQRHKRNFVRSLRELKKAKTFFLKDKEPEIVALHLRDAIHYINEILGIDVVEDVLDKIFSEFCIGK